MFGPFRQSLSSIIVPSISGGSATYKSTVLADSPLAYWRLDESSGATMVDVSGNGHNGTYNSTGVTLGQTGALTGSGDSDTAAAFDGSTGYASSSVSLGTSGTVECWLNLPNTGSFYSYFVGDVADFNGLRITSSNMPSWSDGNVQDVAASTSLSVNTWYHIVATYSPTAVNLYVNGSLAATTSSPNTTAFGTVVVGGRGSGANLCNCVVDEVAVYNTVLSATRILAHYNAGI